MSFTLTRPPSPPHGDHPQNASGTELDHLSSALHAAFQTFTPSHHTSHHHGEQHDMSRDKEKSRLDIVLNSDSIYLKGTGVDVEPALLSGHVALHLTESMSIKGITLQFRGKAKLPPPATEAIPLNNNALTYMICSHDWSFLEGEKRHSHTLKAGRHIFPFQLEIGGSLPSSISTPVFGGASVVYKLRAVAVRPGLSHNLQTVLPVSIIRSFASEALEYQQTLEIENTWPEKLMYSIMIPHKAWAVGDKLTALVKFSPLAKGARVVSVTTNIHETTKLYTRSGAYQEHTRTVASAKHEIINRKAVPVEEKHHRYRLPLLHSHSFSQSVPVTPGTMTPLPPNSPPTSYLDGLSMTGQPRSNSHDSLFPSPSEPGPSTAPPSPATGLPELEANDNDVITYLTITVPLTATASHALDPIIVGHRIRWSILIANLDGHTSELRCSLPVHLLDLHLIDEARAATAATRRLLLGGPEVPPEEQDDMELPSYPAHVRDRVANMYLPEAATIRVTNPWVQNFLSPTLGGVNSGTNSPLEAHLITSHLPPMPGSGASTPLEWVNSELLLSLSNEVPPALHYSPPESSQASNHGSRRHSRAGSPEPRQHGSGGVPTPSADNPNDTYLHGGSHASRNVSSLFHVSMKPFTSLSSHGLFSASRSRSHPSLSTLAANEQRSQSLDTQGLGIHSQSVTLDPQSSSALLHRAFTEVPDYGIASRGFIGGVPPLTSMNGLPSYDQAEREAERPHSS